MATAEREDCTLSTGGVALCNREAKVHGITSVSGAPYLLRTDGTVTVAHEDPSGRSAFSPMDPREDAFREAAAKKLPPMARLVATDHATCGLSLQGDVWCWPEPSYPFSREVQAPLAPVPAKVPGLGNAVELTLMPWLTLCVRTAAGLVHCSAPQSRTTDVCILQGKSSIRCGPQTEGPAGPPDLAGPGYDPRIALARPLVAVPGIDETDPAIGIAAYPRLGYHMGESQRRVFVSNLDEGGCARLRGGTIRCWERDYCAKAQPWRSATVLGLPPNIERMALGANDGYALGKDGALYTWARRAGRAGPDTECASKAPFTLAATREPIAEPVRTINGGTFVIDREPMIAAIDCATLVSGKVMCWRTDASAKQPVEVTFGPSGDAQP